MNELNQLADEKEKAQSITGLLLILLTGVEPERTLAFVESQKGSGHPGTMLEVQTAAFSALARKDSARARRYLESSDWTDRLKEQADMAWAYKDYNAAASWLEAQESSPERDTAISAFATTVGNLDQEAAAIWAGQIEDEALRTTARRRVFTEWNRRDPGAARAWLEQHGMSPSDWIPSAPGS